MAEVLINNQDLNPGDLVITNGPTMRSLMQIGIYIRTNISSISIKRIHVIAGKLVLSDKTITGKSWIKIDKKGLPEDYQEFYKEIIK